MGPIRLALHATRRDVTKGPMGAQGGLGTAIGALALVIVGFAAGAGGAAWQARETRAEPWRKMRVEHEGRKGNTTRTRVVFENPKLALQAVEVIRNPEGEPELARVALRDGEELTVRYEDDSRPTTLEGPDGSRATLSYGGAKARVTFLNAGGKELGDKVVLVPVELRSALRLASRDANARGAVAQGLGGWFIGEAWAQEKAPAKKDKKEPEEDENVVVQRHVELKLDIRAPGAKDAAGNVQIEASCPPFTCLPVKPETAMPGEATVRIAVSGSSKKSALGKPASRGTLEPFKEEASEERSVATDVLPQISTVVAAVGVTALACRSLKMSGAICVADLGSSATGAAVHSVSSHDVETKGHVIDERAEQLYYVDRARAQIDKQVAIEVCLNRDGYARACTKVEGRPFADKPMAPVARRFDMKKGIGGTLAGSFVLMQSDGADCKFSPSPRTTGPFRLTFDNERNTATGSLKADQRGTRPNLRCSLGTANMIWAQNYSITVTQTFTPQELQSGGKLPLRMTGTMNGAGNYSFSNCRTSGGSSANCPGGKSDNYSYQVELVGTLDMPTRTGNGSIIVKGAQLYTRGTWRIPAESTP
jgi:hypothetical protein